MSLFHPDTRAEWLRWFAAEIDARRLDISCLHSVSGLKRYDECYTALELAIERFEGEIAALEWAHLVKRSATRKMKPELRHRTETSVMFCSHHHGLHESGAMKVEAIVVIGGRQLAVDIRVSRRGANDRLRFTKDGLSFTETR